MKGKRFFFIIALLCLAVPSHAGKLKKVEGALSSPPASSSKSSSSSSSSSSSGDSWVADIVMALFSNAFNQMTVRQSSGDSLVPSPVPPSANVRPTNIPQINSYLRSTHSFALPNFRFDGAYQYAFDSVDGMHFRGEAGYLAFGVDVDYTRYYERGTNDNLNILSTHAMLRLPLGHEYLEMDIALGYRRIWEQQVHEGFDFGVPVYLNISQHFQFDFKPYFTRINKRPLMDLDGGVAYKYKWGGVRAGYRYINIDSETLHGPEVGVFFQW